MPVRLLVPLFLPLVAAMPALAQPQPVGAKVSADRGTREIMIGELDPDVLARGRRLEISQDQWRSLCRIGVRPDGKTSDRDTVPLAGGYRVVGATLRFHSRYPLDQPGYRVVIDESLLKDDERKSRADRHVSGPLVVEVDLTNAAASEQYRTIVSAVSPSAAVLPENLLRFYVRFSAPMSRGEAYRRIHLLDSTGHQVSDAFLELDEELWSADGRRFTLLFDPGRIKQGLKPREELGPVLREGKAYSLVVDRDWPDAHGSPLAAGFRKTFRVGPADMSPPSPRDWAVRPPVAATSDPLEIDFPEPLDDALARRLIAVKDPQGAFVQGQVSLDSAETRWSLIPERPWQAGQYQIKIGTELEDLAGNSVGRPFEVDGTRPITARVTSETVSLSFPVRARSR